MMQPFLTILTRVHPARPNCLARNMASVKGQIDQDLQHLLLRPEIEPNDVIKVGPLIHYAGKLIQGRYVMQLPDDDRFASPNFMTDFKAVTAPGDVDVIIFRMEYGDQWICPPDDKWKKQAVEVGYIAGQNAIIRREIYDLASDEWLRPVYEADFYYLKKALSLSKKTLWWDYIGVESQGIIGNNQGKAEAAIMLKPKCTL